MSVFARAASALSQRWAVSPAGQNPWMIPPPGSTMAGGNAAISSQQALQLSAVYACTNLLTGIVSGLPLVAYEEDDPQRRPLPRSETPSVVRDPFGGESTHMYPFLSRRAGLEQIMLSKLLVGNYYLRPIGNPQFPDMLQVIDPNDVTVGIEDDGSPTYRVGQTVQGPGEIIHGRGLTPSGGIMGYSPIECARRTIELGINAEEYGARYFRNGSSPSGIIEMPEDGTPAHARQVKEAWDATHSGMQNAHTIGVLMGGAKFSPISVTPEQAQFLGTRAAQTLDIAMLYGVPPHMIGQVDRTTSWGRGIEEQTQGFLNFTVKNHTNQIEDLFSSITPPGIKVRVDFSELLRPDSTGMAALMQQYRLAAICTINECRAMLGYEPIPGGDDIMAPLNSAHATDPGYQVGAETAVTSLHDEATGNVVDDDGQATPVAPATKGGTAGV